MPSDLMESEFNADDAWVRVECLRAAASIKPTPTPEKMIELAMVFEWYVRGEIPPHDPKELH